MTGPVPLDDIRAVLVEAATGGRTLTYAELVDRVPALEGPTRSGRLGAVLREISLAEDQAGRGLLSAVVVRSRGPRIPSSGFFALAAELGRDTTDRQRCWAAERERVFSAYRG
ncbi:MAG TPA: hypothetical protein VFH45_06390 [Acidimicrobiales bacterium]|nr:hypothetical protein [Acidimicrobiales bacterium]